MESSDTLDVVMTATIRPAVIKLTLESFSRYFLNQFKKLRLIINIDPVGSPGYTADDVLSTVQEYFDDVICRSPPVPSFSRAVRWCWENVESDVFFHLEDDWLLTRKVFFDQVHDLLRSDADVASVRLNKFSNTPRSPTWHKFSLNPSIFKKAYIAEALPFFRDALDPETQFCELDASKKEVLSHWKYVCYGRPGDGAYVIDTGRLWRRYNNLVKWDSSHSQIAWENRTTTHKPWTHEMRYKLQCLYWKALIVNPMKSKFN